MAEDEFKKRKKAADCGCNDADDEFAVQLDSDETVGMPEGVDPRGTKVRHWSGLMAPYGLPTGDGRRFAANALSSRELPLPLKWQRKDGQGHSSSVAVGRIDKIDYREDGVYGSGIIFQPDPELNLKELSENSQEAWFLLNEKVIGPSVDLDDMQWHPLGDPAQLAANERQEIEVTGGRISAATLVQIPAFAEARPFALTEMDATEYAGLTEVVASGVAQGMDALPVAAEATWDVLDLLLRDDAEIEAGSLFALDGQALFPVARIVDGVLSLVPGAVADAVSVLAYHEDRIDLPPGTLQALRGELESLTASCGLPQPPWAQDALVASATGTSTPVAAFKDPKLDGPTPLTIDASGRVYGHLAAWGTCHIGFKDMCVTPPNSKSDYAYFHNGTVVTDEGPIRTGKITLGGGHADTRLGFQAAAEHYDDAGAAVADVRAGEDAYGIWVSGMVRPGLEPQRLAQLAAAPLSGDWRRIGKGMELVAALAVNTPGFPIPHLKTSGSSTMSIVAAGAIVRDETEEDLAAIVAAAVQADRSRLSEQRRQARIFEEASQGLDRAGRRKAALAAVQVFA